MRFHHCCLFALLVPFASATAAVIEVTTLADRSDPRHCSLRDALLASAQAQPVQGCPAGQAHDQDLIRFRAGLRGSIDLQRPVLIASAVRIEGQGSDRIQLRGAELQVQPGARDEVVLSGMNLQMPVRVASLQQLRLEGIRLDGGVGALQTQAGATIAAVVVRDSQFEGYIGAGAALQLGPQASVASLQIRSSRFAQHRGSGQLAAVAVVDAGATGVAISDSDFVGNHSQAGLAGAIALQDVATVQIQRSVFHGNSSPAAGALHVQALAEVRVINTQWFGNQGDQASAVLHHGPGSLLLLHNSLIDQVGPGPVLRAWSSPIELRASLFRQPGGSICSGPVHSLGYNVLAGNGSGDCTPHGSDQIAAILPMQPLFVPQRPTLLLPVQGSPALDLMPGEACSEGDWQTLVDLRGAARPVHPQDTGEPSPRCDAGALERQPADSAGG